MNLNDIRRVAEQYNMCNIDTVLRNALMVGEYYYSSENVCILLVDCLATINSIVLFDSIHYLLRKLMLMIYSNGIYKHY